MSAPGPGSRTFTYAEALATFPRVRELTADALEKIENLFTRVSGPEDLEAQRPELEVAAESIHRTWIRQVTALGCEVKGPWLVDWDSGDGYYCWCWPEEALGHFHGYDEGFAGRLPIQ